MCNKCKSNKCCDPCNSCDPCDPCNTTCCSPSMDDCLAKKIECIWKKTFCDATIIPKIGMPSTANCVMTLTHRVDRCAPHLKINGVTSKSILANNAFYSAEVSDCKWVNLYQILLPNIPGKCGCKSSIEIYIEALIKLGISVDTVSSSWAGSCPDVVQINSKSIGMNPCEFSKKQISAIKTVLKYFKC